MIEQFPVNNKSKVLYISLLAPYDTVNHAGGKVHNFYLKEMQKSGLFDLFLLSMCWQYEVKHLDLDEYGIPYLIYRLDRNKFHRFLRMLTSGFSYINPFDKYCNSFLDYERWHYKRQIKAYAQKKEKPDIVILQWTQIIFLIDYVKKFFPESKIIAIEEDVTFLNYERRIGLAKNGLAKSLATYRYHKIKNLELKQLNKADLVVLNNPKDEKLLEQSGLPSQRLYTLPIFINSYFNVERKPVGKDILYFGYMSRPENYLSVIWFVEQVMPLLDDPEIRFLIVGARPPQELQKIQSPRVLVTGFVEDITPYFAQCLCLAAPLVLGAGIKVKILEAMSAGVPVLTNNIGIEGIPARNNMEYFHCEAPQEYAETVLGLISGQKSLQTDALKSFIQQHYNISKEFKKFMDDIHNDRKESHV